MLQHQLHFRQLSMHSMGPGMQCRPRHPLLLTPTLATYPEASQDLHRTSTGTEVSTEQTDRLSQPVLPVVPATWWPRMRTDLDCLDCSGPCTRQAVLACKTVSTVSIICNGLCRGDTCHSHAPNTGARVPSTVPGARGKATAAAPSLTPLSDASC